MERGSDDGFCEIIEGTFSSSQVDRAGDQIPPEELDNLKDQIKSNPEKRKVLNEHNKDEVIGEIIDVWTEWGEEGEVYYLKGEFGIFEGNENVVREMKNGEKNALSIGGYSYPNIPKKEWGEREPDALVGVPVDEKKSFHSIIEAHDLKYRFKIEKALSETDVFEFLIENHEQVIELVKAITIWYIGRKSVDANIEIPNVTIYSKEVNVNVEKIVENTVVDLNEKTKEGDIVDKKQIRETVEREVKETVEQEIEETVE
ncbi:hypothetical protein [Natrinema pallidum]|uniref:Uncharacterized protein n=1 Tax=Natrinema pallidum TaxID=69527 RepID=A0A4P9TLN8_9EURY|nr:hypothetical protein [Natrinema pallidum]QCW05122.1 hypothetical protein FGF80_17925 [Natrinema pallidum]